MWQIHYTRGGPLAIPQQKSYGQYGNMAMDQNPSSLTSNYQGSNSEKFGSITMEVDALANGGHFRNGDINVGFIAYLSTGWWFGTFFIFPYIGNNHPN